MGDALQDARFKHIATDPRFRGVSRQQRKVKIDNRFRSMFTDDQFKVKYSVDKRGRPLKYTTNENLKKYYELSSSSEDESDKDEANTLESEAKSDLKLEEDESKIDYARGEGVIESSSSSDDDDESDAEENEEELIHPWGEHGTTLTTEEATRRLAVCSLDWDRITAQDIYYLCKSFAPVGGIIKSVKIYLSEFGRERLALEEVKGPKELTENGGCEVEDDENAEEDPEGNRYHTEKLRQYQLGRLNYYYAVVECDNAQTAANIYDQCDGAEFECSASKLDLRFIPDDMEFENEPHSEADLTLDGSRYRPKTFTTTALQCSKVELTWDETNPNRREVIQRAFGKNEEELMEVQAYLASSSEDEESDDEKIEKEVSEDESEDEKSGISKYRALLQDIEKKEEEKKDKDVHLEITWGPGLKEKTEEIVKNKLKGSEEPSPWEEYLKKKKEKKKKKMEATKQMKKEEEEDETKKSEAEEENPYSDDDVPSDVDFNDPYFKEELESDKPKKSKKAAKAKHKKKQEEAPVVDPKEAAELSLLVMDNADEADHKKHFSLRKLMKKAADKKKKKVKGDEVKEDDDDFQMNLTDDRFSALYTSHLFNIDPSEPNFKKTKGIEKVMEEKQKRRIIDEQQSAEKKLKLTSEKEETSAESLTKSKLHQKAALSTLVRSVKNKIDDFNRNVKKKSSK